MTVEALVADPETILRRAPLAEPWPAQETWVWSPDERFRQVELSGAPGIDPARTSLPEPWRSLSAYVLDATAALTLTTRRRGESTPPPSSLSLIRQVWLDEGGTGFSVLDDLSFSIGSARRIDLAEGELGRMTMDGADQLITLGPDGRPGIEVRTLRTHVSAEWRHEGAPSELPAVGWSEDAQSSTATLNLPPGWQLLHASGVDHAPDTWVARWTLLGFFALLVIAAAMGRVMGWPWGLLALLGVGLTFHDEGAPQWIWLALAVLLALHRALAGRRFERWIRWAYLASVAVATVMAVVFAARQLREAHYPQLAEPTNPTTDGSFGGGGWGEHEDWSGAPTAPAPAEEGYLAPSAEVVESSAGHGRGYGGGPGTASDVDGRYSSAWIDPNAVVQTGFGTPTWTWSAYELSFDGPVSRGHRIGLWLSPPWLTRLLSLLRAVFTLALLALVLRKRPAAPPDDAPLAAPAPAVAPLAAALAMLCVASPAQAQAFPSAELLTTLGERLAAPPDCDRCAEANRITVGIEGDRLTVELEVSVAAATAYPLPGPSETWVPETATLDGRPAGALARLESGFLHARLPEGVHTLRLEGPLGGRDAITLAFGHAPRAIAVQAQGWEVDGLAAESVPASIQLRRLASETPSADGEAPTRSVLPTWLEVERRLELGVRWTLASTVRRRSPGDAPAVVRIPLLPGESVNSANVTVENGEALVTLGQTDAEVSWTSTLTPAETITLTAPNAGLLSEVWILACSPLWHCDTSGLSPTMSERGGRWEPRFDPWPGESLTVTTGRPEASEGRSITLDRAVLTVQPGMRLTTSTLDVSARTSVSSTLRITVPAGAEVRSLRVDGADRALQREGDALVIALQPGAHTVTLALQEARGWAFSYPTPAVTLGDATVNLELVVEGSTDRWLLWIDGPAWGPAVLFWPYLALVLVLAFALSRRRTLAPRLHDWALLLAGLTQIPAVAALMVVGWFFLLEHRRDTKLAHPILFVLRQLVVVGATFVACALLLWAIESGLLGAPQMDIQGPECWEQHLRFFVDRSDGALPVATLYSVPTWVFRVLMFCWALWLAFSVLKWARWGWDAFKTDGLFRPSGDLAPPAAPSVAGPAPSEPAPSEPAPESAPQGSDDSSDGGPA